MQCSSSVTATACPPGTLRWEQLSSTLVHVFDHTAPPPTNAHRTHTAPRPAMSSQETRGEWSSTSRLSCWRSSCAAPGECAGSGGGSGHAFSACLLAFPPVPPVGTSPAAPHPIHFHTPTPRQRVSRPPGQPHQSDPALQPWRRIWGQQRRRRMGGGPSAVRLPLPRPRVAWGWQTGDCACRRALLLGKAVRLWLRKSCPA